MKVSFEYTRDGYKKFLLRSRKINNIILFILGIAIYLWLTINKIAIYYLPLFILGLILLIFLLNKIYVAAYLKVNEMLNYTMYGKYTVELTSNKFSVSVNSSKTDYKYNKIKKIVEGKDCFKVKFKNSRDYLTFEKKMFNEKDYNKMIDMFKDKIESNK